MATDTTTPTARPETAACPHCGKTVPDSSWCGACGAHLGRDSPGRPRRRWRSYAAFPDEGLLRASMVSALFPRLASRSRQAFRAALGLIFVVLLALALAKLGAAVAAVSATAVPLLFVCYAVETERADARSLMPAFVALAAGAGLGVAAAIILGRLGSDALVPTVGSLAMSGSLLRAAVLVPSLVQLLMVTPAAVLRLQRSSGAGPLEGFTAGAAGALGLAAAMTLTELSTGMLAGNVARASVLSVVAEAAVRGVSLPLIGAAASGYVGATVWRRTDPGSGGGGRWLTTPLVALTTALAVQVGLGFTDGAGLPDVPLIVVHLGAALLALMALRIGLHHLVLNDLQDVRISGRRPCSKCYRIVPAMPFCPSCGAAEMTMAKAGVDGSPAVDGTEAPPTTGSPTHHVSFPLATRSEVGSIPRLGRRRLLGIMAAGLAIAAGLYIVLAVVLPSGPAVPCVSLQCFTPFGPVRAQPGHTYTSADGWGLTWYPASAVLSGSAPSTKVSSSSDELHLTFSSAARPAEDGDLFFVGVPADGHDAAQLVASLQQSNAPDAVLDYVLPNPTIGYHLGYGAAYEAAPVSTYGDSMLYELVVTCAVVRGEAVCAYGVGPRVDVSQVVNHPTPSALALSLWTNPDVNSVVWKSGGVATAPTAFAHTVVAHRHGQLPGQDYVCAGCPPAAGRSTLVAYGSDDETLRPRPGDPPGAADDARL